MSHRITCHQVSLETSDLETGKRLARNFGEKNLKSRDCGGVRLDEGPHEDHALELGDVGGEGGEEGDQAPHRVADDEQGEAGPGVHHLLAQLDHGPGELVHVPDHHPLPLTLPVTNMIEAKHQEVPASSGLCQLRVIRHQVLCIAGGVIG